MNSAYTKSQRQKDRVLVIPGRGRIKKKQVHSKSRKSADRKFACLKLKRKKKNVK